MTTARSCDASAAAVAAGLVAGGSGKKRVSGLVVGWIRARGRHSEAIGESVRRSILGADGYGEGLPKEKKAVYFSYALENMALREAPKVPAATFLKECIFDFGLIHQNLFNFWRNT